MWREVFSGLLWLDIEQNLRNAGWIAKVGEEFVAHISILANGQSDRSVFGWEQVTDPLQYLACIALS